MCLSCGQWSEYSASRSLHLHPKHSFPPVKVNHTGEAHGRYLLTHMYTGHLLCPHLHPSTFHAHALGDEFIG